MNRETFPRLLQQPEKLYQLNFEELRSLVDQYPYSQNLRFFLAKKAKMENRPEYERLLHLAATYSIDREFLRYQLEQVHYQKPEPEVSPEPLTLPAEQLEPESLDLDAVPRREELTLDDLDRPEPEKIIIAGGAGLTLAELMNNAAPVPAPTPTDDDLDLDQLIAETEAPTLGVLEAEPVDDIVEPTEAAPSIQEVGTTVEWTDDELTPTPKQEFTAYRERYLSRDGDLSILQLMNGEAETLTQKSEKKKRKKAKRAKKEALKRVVRESQMESDELASETLAQLLERQGHYEQAIDMYERLSLIYPEKSSFFAGKIETLKQSL